MKNEQEELLELVKLGLGKDSVCKIPQSVDWLEVFDLAERQKVTAIALDGINRCFEKGIVLDIDFQTKMDWIGAAQQVEVYYQEHEKNMRGLARFYQGHGIKMMDADEAYYEMDYNPYSDLCDTFWEIVKRHI